MHRYVVRPRAAQLVGGQALGHSVHRPRSHRQLRRRTAAAAAATQAAAIQITSCKNSRGKMQNCGGGWRRSVVAEDVAPPPAMLQSTLP